MASESFTRRLTDSSTDSGFQFTFYCDICQNSLTSAFVPAKVSKHSGFLHGLAEIANIGADLEAAKDPQVAQALRSSAMHMNQGQVQNQSRSPAWHQEHDSALAAATATAKQSFNFCSTCRRWVCSNDWDAQSSMCVQDSTKKSSPAAGTAASTTSTPAKTTPSNAPPQAATGADDPVALLKLRLAKGEITLEQFKELRQALDEQ